MFRKPPQRETVFLMIAWIWKAYKSRVVIVRIHKERKADEKKVRGNDLEHFIRRADKQASVQVAS
jgi:hypothetical protein